MNKVKQSTLALLLCVAGALGLLGGCAGSDTTASAERGHLVIVGGGLEDDNAAVFNRFVELCADGPIGIIPTSSFDGVESGVSNVARWKKYSGTRDVIAIPLTKDDAAKADDPAIAAQIASCGGLWFTGGDQSRTTAVMRPEGRRTAVLDACFKVLDRGGVIGGTSAGAAIMSNPMITGGQSRGRATRDPEEEASPVTLGQGLGFFSFGLTDQHFLERGRMGRLAEALHRTGTRLGLGVSENCAAVVNWKSGDVEALGNRAVCQLLVEPKERKRTALTARLAVLSTGDRTSAITGRVVPAAGLEPPVYNTGLTKQPPPRPNVTGDPWALRNMTAFLDRFEIAAEDASHDGLVHFELVRTGSTRVLVDPLRRRPACLVDLHMTACDSRLPRKNPKPWDLPFEPVR